ncbi:Branchpoint-bridging protein [Aphelenchoides besseyi]|nr:Branchpoint-bridging protein [Aphelenchoides besseyi]
MGRRDASKTGANTEPLPFVRQFGGVGGEQSQENFDLSSLADMQPINQLEYGVSTSGADDSRKWSSPARRSRSHSRERSKSKSKRRKRSRDDSYSSSRRRRSRSRSREHRRRKHSRSRSDRSRSPRRSDHGAESSSRPANPPPFPPNASLPAPIVEVANKLPPHLRGQVVAQSLLVKPEALPQVLNQAIMTSTAHFHGTMPTPLSAESGDGVKERKKKSRWSTTKQFVPGMITILPSNLDDNQRKGYLLQLEIEEATRKLRLAEFSTPEGVERSPSPEPVYDSNGKRLNTRDVRKRQELEQLRHEKIQALLKVNPAYKPPADYRAPNIRLHDKVYIPQEMHPEINFVGLLIGPRGNTLKALEAETQAKIIIRGKGSVKEGKLGRREGPMPGENEPLHAFVTGPDRDIIKKACAKITEIINAALLIPDGQNELRKLQLRELAVLNGTLRPEDIMNAVRCSNCGSDQHKTWECPDAPNVTANIICTLCGNAGHIARDCKAPRTNADGEIGVAMDDEYSALMAELGEKPAEAKPAQGAAQFGTFKQPFLPGQTTEAEGPSQSFAERNATGYRGRGAYGYGGRGGYKRKANTYDESAYGYGSFEPESTVDPQTAAYMSQWAAGLTTEGYGNGYEGMSGVDMSAYYQHYGMDASGNWIPPPPTAPDASTEVPSTSTAADFQLIAPPPPPPPSD